ncbi:MAG: hypothetical protein AB8G14_13455 [Ilumatobacter sp.]
MRQVLTWRFFAALGALALLALGVDAVFGEPAQEGSFGLVGPSNLDQDGDLIARRIDIISSVERIERSPDFALGEDGRTVGVFDAVLDANRVMRIAPGTPGEISCRLLTLPDRCVVLADVLGEAVVWFAVLPKGPGETVELPPIVDLQDGFALFGNGWEVLYPPIIERDEESCAGEDIPSFSDFVVRFGPNSTTIVDLETQQVALVTCGEEFVAPPTTERSEGSLDGSFVPLPASTVPELLDPDVEAPDN